MFSLVTGLSVGKKNMMSKNKTQITEMKLTAGPILPSENARSGRTLSRPRQRTIACGRAHDVCKKITAAPTIAEKAVVDPRKMRPYSCILLSALLIEGDMSQSLSRNFIPR